MRLHLPLITVAIATALTAAAANTSAVHVDRVVAELEPEITRAMIEGRIPSATVALVAGEQVIWTGAYGYSNIWARTPAVPSTVYLIGSTFKAMATVALLQQMEQGKFKLDDAVNNYLTDFKIQNDNPANPVTFRELLTHTSGLPADFGGFPLWGDAVPPSLQDYLSKSLKIAKPPLTSMVYSNMAYTLVGYLVQKFSGTPFKQYIDEHIWRPLQMTSTAFAPTPAMEERLSIPYALPRGPDPRPTPAQRVRASVWPAGIVYGTVLDQANWLITNLNNGVFDGKRIISEETMNQMFTRQYDQFKGPVEGIWGNASAGVGLTWWVEERDGDHFFAHSGSVQGYTAFLLGNRDRKLGFAILTNGDHAHPHLFKLADRALDLMKLYSDASPSAPATGR